MEHNASGAADAGCDAGSVITAIEPQEHHPDRRSIFVNGEFAVGVHFEVVLSLGLAVGQRVDRQHLAEIAKAEALRRAKDYALRLLSYRQRTQKEIHDRLKSKGYDDETISAVLAQLAEIGLVNDSAFADAWVNWRRQSKPAGRTLLKWELRAKGVPPEVTEDVLSQLGPEQEREDALTAARRKLRQSGTRDPQSAKRGLTDFLRRRGYDWDVIRYVLNTLAEEGQWEPVDPDG